ncbi:MAG: hydrogenase formation protein HypD [Pseudomonadota bacterium]
MKYQDEFRDGALARRLAARLREASTRPVRLMEICGTHTVAIFRHGLRSILPETIKLISGPGCPVCVTAAEEMDRAIRLARTPGVRVAAYGDLIKVPGSESSLKEEMADGAKVTVVYSSLDALDLARRHPNEEVVFLGIGFETTAPTAAAAVLTAARAGLENFSILSAHKLLPPALDALLSDGEVKIDGFLCPGHVTTIIGTEAYQRVAREHEVPSVVTGFEPVDILQGILMLVELLEAGRAEALIQYKRGASEQGNPKAREIMNLVFEPVDSPWRGLGRIPLSGLDPRPDFAKFDARKRFDLEVPPAQDPPGCRCGQVLKGVLTPRECPLFDRVCQPDRPVGPCMVSSEGTCAAYYKYGR